jgi:hypothetical protein
VPKPTAKREALVLQRHLDGLRKQITITRATLDSVTPTHLTSTATGDLDAALQNVLSAVDAVERTVDFESGYLKP